VEGRVSFTLPPAHPSLLYLYAFNDRAAGACSRSLLRQARGGMRLENTNRCHVQERTWNKSDNPDTQARRRRPCSP